MVVWPSPETAYVALHFINCLLIRAQIYKMTVQNPTLEASKPDRIERRMHHVVCWRRADYFLPFNTTSPLTPTPSPSAVPMGLSPVPSTAASTDMRMQGCHYPKDWCRWNLFLSSEIAIQQKQLWRMDTTQEQLGLYKFWHMNFPLLSFFLESEG